MYYDGANWQWGDKMGKLIDETFAKQIMSDLDRLKEVLMEIRGTDKVDVSCHPINHPMSNVYGMIRCDKCCNYYKPVEKKEPRKLWKQILDEAMPLIDNNLYVTCSKNAAKVAIDAVIECYEEWPGAGIHGSFPEYLKEKLL